MISLLYTHNLRGNIELLPRLYTFIRQLKAQPVADEDEVMICHLQPQTRRTLIIDAGESCAPDAWHCAVTSGRSMLVALDAMGYDAARSSLTPDLREKLAGEVNVALVDETHGWEIEGVVLTLNPSSPNPFSHIPQGFPAVTSGEKGDKTPLLPGTWERGMGGEGILRIAIPPANAARLDSNVFTPAILQAGQVGVAHFTRIGTRWLVEADVLTMPAATLPDPTITAAVEFILSEARYLQKRQAG